MMHIDKGNEPHELGTYRARAGAAAAYNVIPGSVKDAMRKALVDEQGHLCAYCMRRIKANLGSMKMEHIHNQSNNASQQLDWNNLLGVCNGGEGFPKKQQHCDTHKGDSDLVINLLQHPERLLRYHTNGSITSDDAAIRKDINEVLNLNLEWLQHNRASAWNAILDMLKKRYPVKVFPKQALLKEIDRYRPGRGKGKLPEYSGYILYFLTKKLQRVARRSSGRC